MGGGVRGRMLARDAQRGGAGKGGCVMEGVGEVVGEVGVQVGHEELCWGRNCRGAKVGHKDEGCNRLESQDVRFHVRGAESILRR